MPKNKDAYSRYKVIDQILRQVDYVKTSRLSEICSDRLGIPISKRTIQKDIRDLVEDSALQIYAPIKYCSRQKAYYYPENVNSIFPAIELEEDEISALLFYGRIHSQHSKLGIFSEITSAIEKVIDSSNIKNEYKEAVTGLPLILIEKTPPLKGSELLLKIIQALRLEKQIIFEYFKFGDCVRERVISPYLLKEDRHLWYVVGYYENRGKIITFAVDRMAKVRIVDKPIVKIKFNANEYFKYSFGITVPEYDPIEVTLLFTPLQGNYIKALPIHESQKIISDDIKGLTISVFIKPSYEFFSKLLSYGADVKVLGPQNVIDSFQDKIASTLKLYSK